MGERAGQTSGAGRQRDFINDLIKTRKDNYLHSQRDVLLGNDACRNFFQNVKAFKSKNRPRQFNVSQLFPGLSDAQVSEELVVYFMWTSSKFQPLEPQDLPRTRARNLPYLLRFQVAGRIRAIKKPELMVRGDIFPALMHKYDVLLATPLTNIYNVIICTLAWPRVWKQEFRTVQKYIVHIPSLQDFRK